MEEDEVEDEEELAVCASGVGLEGVSGMDNE